MLLKAPLSVVLLTSSAYTVAEPMPYKLGSRSANPAYGLMKRQDGYQPQEVRCGPGVDCAASCGANYIQCASTDGDMHCYDPTVKKEKCCPNGTGNSCRDGYFCTSDSSGGTWCCPDGMDLVTCAKRYHLTGILVSQTVTATPTPSKKSTLTDASVTTPAVNPTYTTYNYNNTYINATYTKPPYSNPTYTNTTTYITANCTKSCHATNLPPSNTSVIIVTTATPTPTQATPTSTPAPSQVAGAVSAYTIGLPGLLFAAVGFAIAL